MRQPLSIYLRAARLGSIRFTDRVIRKLRKVARVTEPKPAPASRPLIDLRHLDEALAALGVGRGDRLIVHSGISHLGKVKAGPQGVLRLLRERVGDEGLLLFPAFPFGTLMYEYLRGDPSFDARTSPAKMGAVVDMALAEADRLRSVHPTHSVAAIGRDARDFVADHHLDPTPFGPHSPFWRLADAGGKILVIGVGLSSVTGFHLTEDRMGAEFPVRVYRDEVFTVACRDDAGENLTVRTPAHDPFISRIRDCYLVEDTFLKEGLYRKAPLGTHYLGVLDFAAMDVCLQRLARSARQTIYGPIWG